MSNLKIGDRVIIIGNHPWTGHSGEIKDIKGYNTGDWDRDYRLWVVKLDNGIKAGAGINQLRKIS